MNRRTWWMHKTIVTEIKPDKQPSSKARSVAIGHELHKDLLDGDVVLLSDTVTKIEKEDKHEA